MANYPVYYIKEINEAIDRKNENIKRQMEQQKGTNRRTF
tara:strand:+ start:2147 stop:2263 length:117 start_codon:yes stop_codon:yes gene_type:complete